MPTALFNALEKRVDALASRLLPPLSPTGTYSDAQYDFVRAYIVLVHAEIETYLEDTALSLASTALAKWTTRQRVNRGTATLLLHYDASHTPHPRDASTHIHNAIARFRGVVRENHGIREKYLWSMYLPLGIDKAEVSPTLIAELESFGAARGKVAHLSARGVLTPPDPQSTLDQTSLLVAELRDFDVLCIAARSR